MLNHYKSIFPVYIINKYFFYLCINSRESWLTTSLSPADNAPQVGNPQFIFTNQRTSTVPLTGVYTAIQITCAHTNYHLRNVFKAVGLCVCSSSTRYTPTCTHHARFEASFVECLTVGDEGYVGPEQHLSCFAIYEKSSIFKH